MAEENIDYLTFASKKDKLSPINQREVVENKGLSWVFLHIQ